MEVNRQGVARIVLLTRRWAFKVPNFLDGWRAFLKGLLSNIQECEFSAMGSPKLCPVCFSIPGGFLVVMPRARVMSREEFAQFDVEAFVGGDDIVPAEPKWNSYGYLDGRIVAIDYGN